jgi:hypothetical protein
MLPCGTTLVQFSPDVLKLPNWVSVRACPSIEFCCNRLKVGATHDVRNRLRLTNLRPNVGLAWFRKQTGCFPFRVVSIRRVAGKVKFDFGLAEIPGAT